MKRPSQNMLRRVQLALTRKYDKTKEPVSLWEVSLAADAIAREAGRKTELFSSLDAYSDVLPGSWTTRWIGDSSGSMLYAVPRSLTEPPATMAQMSLALNAAVGGDKPVSFQRSPELTMDLAMCGVHH